MTKLNSKDFVCVKDNVKMVDLDELRLGELKCVNDKDCYYAGFDIGSGCPNISFALVALIIMRV